MKILEAVLILLTVNMLGCSVDGVGEVGVDSGVNASDDSATSDTEVDSSLAQLCIDQLNAKRALLGIPALARNASQEACVYEECQMDSASGIAHESLGHCGEANQSQCEGGGYSSEELIPTCINDFFEEGPGSGLAHAHYTMLVNPVYTSAACSIYQNGSFLWFIVDYYQ